MKKGFFRKSFSKTHTLEYMYHKIEIKTSFFPSVDLQTLSYGKMAILKQALSQNLPSTKRYTFPEKIYGFQADS